MKHQVEQGECVNSLAKQYGVSAKTIWEHPSNSELKQKRQIADVLMPGDEIEIPDDTKVEHPAETEKQHVFTVKSERVKLDLRMMREDQPRANVKYTLTIGGQIRTGETDEDGWIRETIDASVQTAKLTLQPHQTSGETHVSNGNDNSNGAVANGAGNTAINSEESEEEYELLLGHLDPIDEKSGVQGRLWNLGFFFDFNDNEDEAIQFALEQFQGKNNLAQTGEIDAATIEKLKQIHGS